MNEVFRSRSRARPFTGSAFAIAVLLLVLFASEAPLRSQDCSVTPHPSWKDSIELSDEPFAVAPYQNPRWVKFTILTCDPQKVYFQQSRDFPFHYDFATEHLDPFLGMSREEFDAVTLHPAGQRAVLGAVILPPSGNPSAEFGIQLVAEEPYPPQRVVELFHAVEESVVHDGAEAYYFPTFEQTGSALANEAFLARNGVVLGSADRWSEGNSIYAEGWALGELEFVPASEITLAYVSGALRPEDVLLTDGVPAEVPFVAGILSLAPATPNSHVAILARNYGVPFVHLSRPDDAARARDLDGRRVIVSAFQGFEGGDVRLLDVEGRLSGDLVSEILALKELPPLEITPVSRAGAYSLPVAGLRPADIGIAGGKAANYSLILESIPENTRVAAAFTFDLWLDFLAQPLGGGRTLREEIAARLAPFTAFPPADVAGLASALEGVRDLFEDPDETVFSPELRAAVIDTLEDPLYAFDPERKIRFRSSTNVEDSSLFTGAGLYESASGCLLDDLDGDELGPSRCDPGRLVERGIFRAIRRVFASFYNQNAYLERRRWGVDEEEVGMAVLVHHSFPDELELANGVATLTRRGPNYEIEMVTQKGATSVANPADGSIPETVRVTVFRSGTKAVELVRESNLVQLGARVLEWKAEYEAFGELFVSVAKAFEKESGKDRYTLDLEYKKIDPGGQLIVKQVRELPELSGGEPGPVFFIDVPRTFTTFQGEAADVFSNHHLKSTWRFEARSFRLTEESLREGLFTGMEVDFSDGCEELRFEGPVSSLPGAEARFEDDQTSRLSWRFDDLPNPRNYEIIAGPFPFAVPVSRSPFLTLADLFLSVRVTHDRPVLGWKGFDFDPKGTGLLTGPTTEQAIRLAPEPEPRPGDLEQTRVVEEDGVSVTTRFFWPPPPTGIVAGYTAPLVRWVETRIEGLTEATIVLRGDRSQTYRPEHHNFSEHFIFSPHEEEGISGEILAELDQKDVRWIHVLTGNLGRRVELYGACDLALACACEEVTPVFRRGDCNDDGKVNLSDAVCKLSWLFQGGETPGCVAATDANGDDAVNITDVIVLLDFLFLGGPPPPSPFPGCGPAPSPPGLGCETPPEDCVAGG